jgi:3-deoxy-manno-octulosonate cytidylyltransferase (CMP-KDO synthetase)
MIKGKTMIERVYRQSCKVLEHVYVATDDERIEKEVKRFGGKVIMTSSLHQSGTDRCAEAIRIIEQESGITFNVVINIQGDEPFIQPEHLVKLMKCFESNQTQIATLVKPVKTNDDIFNPNYVKVVIDKNNRALYFSRSAIPFLRNHDSSFWQEHHSFYQHLGIYAYRTEILKEITLLAQSPLEIAESLEQLRWLQNGYSMHVEQTEAGNISVDTPADLEKINLLDFPDL